MRAVLVLALAACAPRCELDPLILALEAQHKQDTGNRTQAQ